MIIADQHNKTADKTTEKGTPRKPDDAQTESTTARTGSARSALPHAGEPIGHESDTGTTKTSER